MMRRLHRPAVALALLCVLAPIGVLTHAGVPAAVAGHAGTHWVRSWGTSLQAPDDPVDYPEAGKIWNNVTIRQTVRLSVGGSRLSVRLSNRFGAGPLSIGGVRIAVAGTGAMAEPRGGRAVLFGGRPSIVIPTGAPVISDPVELPVTPLQELVISLYLPRGTGPTPSLHLEAKHPALLAEGGDQTAATTLARSATSNMLFFIEGIDVEAPADAATVVALGDSITDGYGSTLGTYRTWPDRLAEGFSRQPPRRALAVINAGISGNRMLHDIIGPAALERFDRDALDVPGVKLIVLLEGVNDLYRVEAPAPFRPGETSTADDLIFAFGQMIERAHRRGVKIIGATIMPDPEDVKTNPTEEIDRQLANLWIRSKSGFDAVVDFDEVMRDPRNPGQLRPSFDSGDHLHPNDAGYQAMAGAVAELIARMER